MLAHHIHANVCHKISLCFENEDANLAHQQVESPIKMRCVVKMAIAHHSCLQKYDHGREWHDHPLEGEAHLKKFQSDHMPALCGCHCDGLDLAPAPTTECATIMSLTHNILQIGTAAYQHCILRLPQGLQLQAGPQTTPAYEERGYIVNAPTMWRPAAATSCHVMPANVS